MLAPFEWELAVLYTLNAPTSSEQVNPVPVHILPVELNSNLRCVRGSAVQIMAALVPLRGSFYVFTAYALAEPALRGR